MIPFYDGSKVKGLACTATKVMDFSDPSLSFFSLWDLWKRKRQTNIYLKTKSQKEITWRVIKKWMSWLTRTRRKSEGQWISLNFFIIYQNLNFLTQIIWIKTINHSKSAKLSMAHSFKPCTVCFPSLSNSFFFLALPDFLNFLLLNVTVCRSWVWRNK